MAAPAILFELLECGIEPTLTADGASIEVPAGRLSDAQRRAIRAHKAELIHCIREAEGITENLVRQTKAVANDDAHHPVNPPPALAVDGDQMGGDGQTALQTAQGAVSTGDHGAAHHPTDEEIERYLSRTVMLMGRGLAQPQAERLAQALTRRDRDLDDRRCCLECAHLSGTRHPRLCHAAHRAGLTLPPRPPHPLELPRTWAMRFQRCDGFGEATP